MLKNFTYNTKLLFLEKSSSLRSFSFKSNFRPLLNFNSVSCRAHTLSKNCYLHAS